MRITATLFKRNGIYYLKWSEVQVDPEAIEGDNLRYVERRMSLKTRKKNEAIKLRDAHNEELIRRTFGVPLEKPKLTPALAWARYIAFTQKKPNTLATEKIFWDQFFAFCPINDIEQVRRHQILDWRQHLLAGGNRPITVNDKIRALRCIYNHLINAELIRDSPFNGIKLLDEGEKRPKFHPWGKVQKCLKLAAAEGRDIHLVFILGALGGLRRNEILMARWEHVNWKLDQFQVAGTKTKSSAAVVHLHPSLKAALKPYRQTSGYIVAPDKALGTWRYRWEFRKPFSRVTAAAGIPDATVHSLRHSFATHLLNKGYSLAEIAACLRHSSIRTTEVYADLKGVQVKLRKL